MLMTIAIKQSAPTFSLGRVYHRVIDTIDARIGGYTAHIFDNLTAIFSSMVFFIPQSILKAQGAHWSIGLPVAMVGGVAFLVALVTFRRLADEYRREELKQITSCPTQNEKTVVIIEAADSDNGSFFESELYQSVLSNPRLFGLRANILKISETHTVRHIIASSEEQTLKELDSLGDQTVDLLLIKAHGYPGGMYLNKNFWIGSQSDALMNKIAQKIRDKASCILDSCSTGRGEENIAKLLSASWKNATVHAPTENVNMFTKLDNEFRPHYFFGAFHKVPSHSYFQGIECPT